MKVTRKYHYEKTALHFGDLELIQIGTTHCTKDYAADDPIHLHRNWFELTHVVQGKGTIATNSIATEVAAGDLYLSFPGDIHGVYTDQQDLLNFQFLSLWPTDTALLRKLEQIMRRHSDPKSRVFRDADISYLIGSSISEVIMNDDHSPAILDSALHQILRYIFRAFGEEKRPTKKAVGSDRELCYQMMNYISTHIYVMDKLSELSDFFGYSYSYLSDLFHKTTGDTLMNYYTNRRLDAAALLLKEDDLSVSAIAELLQYSSIYTFSKAFKNHMGASPTLWQRQNKATTG